MGGFDDDGLLHVSADVYRFEFDFYPGPVMDSVNYSYDLDVKWNRVWKISQQQIVDHRNMWQNPDYVIPENIAEWPAHGDTTLGMAWELAPYYDFDENGFYSPGTGDFPITKGDQSIFTIFNDDRFENGQTPGRKLGVEVQAMYYAFDRPADSALNNSIFVNYKIINRSHNTYADYYQGFFTDFDLGCPIDDHIGCDTILNAAYAYNGESSDCNYSGIGSYTNFPPAVALSCLNFNMSSFMYFIGYGPTPTGDPVWDYHYYNALKGIWRDSTHLTYGQNGYGGTVPVMFGYPGDPVTGEGWSEISDPAEPPGDRRGVLSTGPFEFKPGDELSFDLAFVFARSYQENADDNHLKSVELMKGRILSVKDHYESSLEVNEHNPKVLEVNLFPNPVHNTMAIADIKGQFAIFDILGELKIKGRLSGSEINTIDVSKLNNGIYFIRIQDGFRSVTKKIIKN